MSYDFFYHGVLSHVYLLSHCCEQIVEMTLNNYRLRVLFSVLTICLLRNVYLSKEAVNWNDFQENLRVPERFWSCFRHDICWEISSVKVIATNCQFVIFNFQFWNYELAWTQHLIIIFINILIDSSCWCLTLHVVLSVRTGC